MEESSFHNMVPPVMEVPESDHGTLYVVSIVRDGITYLAVCLAEQSPLWILEFLHRMADIFSEHYLGGVADEAAMKDNFSTIYQLLEEMVDYGWPLTTEPNALRAMIRPPTVYSKLQEVMTGSTNTLVSDALPSGTVSNMPWRAAGVSYTQNEIYIDIIEEVDAILDAMGNIISSDVNGSIHCQCHLSGIPDLLLTFQDPSVIDDCAFHPCVRYQRFEQDDAVSFVPPDGNFILMKYRIVQQRQNPNGMLLEPPMYCHPQWNVSKSANAGSFTGRLVLQVGVRTMSSLIYTTSRGRRGPMVVEDVSVLIPFPKSVKTATAPFQVTVGSVIYDEASKVARWTIGKIDSATTSGGLKPQLTATLELMQDELLPHVSMQWKIPLASVSGLTVGGLSLTGEAYRPYKGVRNITKSGLFQIRCSN